jgi:hypothetical protein
MINFNRSLRILTIYAAACTLCLASQAATRQAAIFYEDGVNAYFSGRACDAESYLSSAIEANSQDPRAYYFRALSLLRQGRIDLARGDMLTGARLEARQANRYAIGSALERVQGPTRLMLEEFRRHARLAAASASSEPAATGEAIPSRTFREGEADVLREKKFVPLEELLRPEGPRSIVAEPPATPSAVPPVVPPQPGAPAVVPDTQPATPPATAPPEENPFGDDAAEAAPSAAPPSAPPVPPQDAPKPATPPVEDENPFGG